MGKGGGLGILAKERWRMGCKMKGTGRRRLLIRVIRCKTEAELPDANEHRHSTANGSGQPVSARGPF